MKNRYPDIIFKASDKNLGLCAMTRVHYKQLVKQHLDNPDTYTLVSQGGLATKLLHQDLVTKLRNFELDTYWSDTERTFLKSHRKQNPEPTFPKFYCNPKLHKDGPLKGRPIAGAVNWITTPISRILDRRLQRHLSTIDHILPNSQTLVKDLQLANSTFRSRNDNPAINQGLKILIITGDVEALYPNINTTLLRNLIDKLDPTLTSLCEFICNNNYVTFDNHIYHQIQGIAMGTNAAVSLANFYLSKVIDSYLGSRPQMLYYKRYIDDLFIIWTGSLREWHIVATHCNRINSRINIEFSDPSPQNAQFLDLNITFDPFSRQFSTSIYQKSLNRYLYLTPSSFHVPHTFSGFIKGELTRYARLCTDVFTFQHIRKLFYTRLISRGYSRLFINTIFRKVPWSARLKIKTDPPELILPFIVPYTNRRNFNSVEEHFKNTRNQYDEYLSDSKSLLVYSRTQNVNDILTHDGPTTFLNMEDPTVNDAPPSHVP
jgi:hypothetical protein